MEQSLLDRVLHRRKPKKLPPAPLRYRVEKSEDLVTAATWMEKRPLLLEVPPHLLVMQGGFRYNQDHPFVAALRDGAGVLKDFYQKCQPKNLSEYYGLNGDTRVGAELPPWEIPWLNRFERLPPPGEEGLGPEHGYSFFGPVTEEKVHLEMQRLENTKASIQKNGYNPQEFGYIVGHVLYAGREDGAVFYVRGGKHRAAVLSHMGQETVPVIFKRNFQRVVDFNQRACWPLVRSGDIDETLASDIFMSYVRNDAK